MIGQPWLTILFAIGGVSGALLIGFAIGCALRRVTPAEGWRIVRQGRGRPAPPVSRTPDGWRNQWVERWEDAQTMTTQFQRNQAATLPDPEPRESMAQAEQILSGMDARVAAERERRQNTLTVPPGTIEFRPQAFRDVVVTNRGVNAAIEEAEALGIPAGDDDAPLWTPTEEEEFDRINNSFGPPRQ